jgi:hypothetical protein
VRHAIFQHQVSEVAKRSAAFSRRSSMMRVIAAGIAFAGGAARQGLIDLAAMAVSSGCSL